METTNEAKERLWAEGYLVGVISVWNCPVKPAYADASGKVYLGKEREGRKLAALHTEGFKVVEIQFFDLTRTPTPEEIEAHYESLLPSPTTT